MLRHSDRGSQVRSGLAAGGDEIRTLGSAPPLRDRRFADSPLEGDGVEPSVPRMSAKYLRPVQTCEELPKLGPAW